MNKLVWFLFSLFTLSLTQKANLIRAATNNLTVPLGSSVLKLKVYQNYIYAIVGNLTGFMVVKYDWTNNLSVVNQSAFTYAYTNLTYDSKDNPSITVDHIEVQVVFYEMYYYTTG